MYSPFMHTQNVSVWSDAEESQTLSASPAAALPLPGSPALCSTLNDSGCESSEGVPVGQKLSTPSTHSTSILAASSKPDVAMPAPPPPPPPPLPMLPTSSPGESVAEVIRKVT